MRHFRCRFEALVHNSFCMTFSCDSCPFDHSFSELFLMKFVNTRLLIFATLLTRKPWFGHAGPLIYGPLPSCFSPAQRRGVHGSFFLPVCLYFETLGALFSFPGKHFSQASFLAPCVRGSRSLPSPVPRPWLYIDSYSKAHS